MIQCCKKQKGVKTFYRHSKSNICGGGMDFLTVVRSAVVGMCERAAVCFCRRCLSTSGLLRLECGRLQL